jgi:hypothetical protein
MKLDIKPSKALVVGGIILASAFVLIAIVRPESLDWILGADEQSSEQIKQEMERQKGIDTSSRSDAQSKRGGETQIGAVTPSPSPAGERPGDEGITKPECISRDQVVEIIGASEEAREGRVIEVSITQGGNRVMVAYRKRTFLGIGSGENQIEGILRRGLRNQFPDRLIKTLKVRSQGKRSVLRGAQNVNVEVLAIEAQQAVCRWPPVSAEPR